MTNFKFIDLFAGIGGFHQAMRSLGGECVFASDIDENAINVYKNNYGIDARHDITKVDAKDIPAHDVLCGGFPCQASLHRPRTGQAQLPSGRCLGQSLGLPASLCGGNHPAGPAGSGPEAEGL